MSKTTVLYDSPIVHAALDADGRLRLRRGGADGKTVCNVSAERIVEAVSRPDGPTESWLALCGAVDRVDFAQRRAGEGWVGPFAADETANLVAAIRAGLALPRTPCRVSIDSLRDEPERWHERLIECEGEWFSSKDASSFAGAWVYPPVGTKFGDGGRRVRIVGFFRCTGSRDFDGRRDGHGPFGTAPAECDAISIEPLG